MRRSFLTALPLLGALLAAPQSGGAQTVVVQRGTPVLVTQYAPDAFGDWRTSLTSWRPATLYTYDGKWYTRTTKDARPVMLYRSPSGVYFLPPQDAEWKNKKDKRFNYGRLPTADDYQRAMPPKSRGLARGRGMGRGTAMDKDRDRDNDWDKNKIKRKDSDKDKDKSLPGRGRGGKP